MSQFHETRIGQQFLDRTMPDLVRQLTQLNDLLERIATALEKRERDRKA
jgi:hypothetical protein